MFGEIVAAGGTKLFHLLGTFLLEGEIDDMGKLLFCHDSIPFLRETGLQVHGLSLERFFRIVDLAGLIICCVVPFFVVIRASLASRKPGSFKQ